MTEVSHLSPLHPQSDLRRNNRESTPGSEDDSDARSTSKRFKPNFGLLNEQSTWNSLLLVAESILATGSDSQYSYENTNRQVGVILNVKASYQSKLSNVLLQHIDASCAALSLDVERSYESGNATDQLTAFVKLYLDWCARLRILSNSFIGLNPYLHRHPTKKTLYDHGVNAFVVLYWINDQKRLVSVALDALSNFRRESVTGTLDQSSLSRTLVHFFQMASINDYFYKTLLGTAIMDRMLQDYAKGGELHEHIMKLYPSQFLSTVHEICFRESEFYKLCRFDESFVKRAILKLDWLLVLDEFNIILPDIIEHVFQNYEQRLLFFGLCDEAKEHFSLDLIPSVRKTIQTIIIERITRFLDSTSLKDYNRVVNGLYKFQNLKGWATPSEGSDPTFQIAFSKVISLKKYNLGIINLLCKYIDNYSRTSLDEQVEFEAKVMFIVTGLYNKVDFCESYKKDLCRRLLLWRWHKSSDSSLLFQLLDEHVAKERSLFELLQDHIGKDESTIVSISQMFTDLLKINRTCIIQGTNFMPAVLSASQWPSVPRQTLKVPPELNSILQLFETDHFKIIRENKHKQLDWSAYSVHQLMIATSFASGKKDLYVNMLQATVLYAFQEKDELTIDELKEITGMGDGILKSIVASFEKYKVLLYNGNQNSVHFNFNLHDKRSKIRIPLARESSSSLSSTAQPLIKREQTVDRNDEFRSTIVRHMKSVKSEKYEEVLQNVVEMAEKRGPFLLTDIKKCIEELIKDGYVERLGVDTIRYIP